MIPPPEFHGGVIMPVRWLRLASLLFLIVPAASSGEIVKLRDQSVVRGRLVQVDGDTLVFKSTFGTLRFHRQQVISIVFDDSAESVALVPPPPITTAPAGRGRIEVVFKDRELSSKIAIDLRKDWDAHVSSNHILVELLVDGQVVHTDADTTMDKTINKGHKTVLKNDIELADFGVDVDSGLHHAKIVVRNRDTITYRGDFDPEPLDMVVPFDNIDIRPGEVYRLDVGITKGKLKMGQSRLVPIK
jgi:hypothetical protein